MKIRTIRIALLMVLVSVNLGAYSAQPGSAIYIFGAKIEMPSNCILFAHPSISDGHIAYTCHIDNPHEILKIDLLKASECPVLTTHKIKGRTVQIVDNEQKWEYKSRKYIAQKVVFQNGNVFYVRTIKDSQDCIFVSSPDNAEVEQVLKPLWVFHTKAGEVKNKR